MTKDIFTERIALAAGVQATVHGSTVSVKGPKGTAEYIVAHPTLKTTLESGALVVQSSNTTKRGKKLVQSCASHFRNLVEGVTKGFVYKLKVCTGHFPVTVKVEKDTVVISNFLGEKIPRTAKILSGVSVKVSSDILTVEGADLEHVSQTAGNIEQATRILARDRRRFQDGIYITEKAGVTL